MAEIRYSPRNARWLAVLLAATAAVACAVPVRMLLDWHRAAAAPTLSFSTYPYPQTGLLSLWRFDESSGATAYDSVRATADDATILGSYSTRNAGGYAGGGYLTLPGVTDNKALASLSSTINGKGAVTMGCWARIAYSNCSLSSIVGERPSGSQLTAIQTYPGYGEPPDAYWTIWFIMYTDATEFTPGMSGLFDPYAFGLSTFITGDQWHHIVATWTSEDSDVGGDGTIRVYVDGALAIDSYMMGFTTWGGRLLQTVPFSFGEDTVVGDRWFAGDIDEVFVYDRALSDSEIYTLYLDTFFDVM